MNQKLKRMKDAIAREGWYAFLYLIKEQFRELRSEEVKYRLWRRIHEDKVHPALLDSASGITVVVQHGVQDERTDNGYEILECEDRSLRQIADMAGGDWLVLVQDGYRITDTQAQRLVSHLADRYYEDKSFVYVDCDVMDDRGKRKKPFFRPDYSPDTLRSFFYMEGVLALKKKVVERLVQCADIPLAGHEYEMALEASFVLKPSQIAHIPEILCHRMSDWNMNGQNIDNCEKQRRKIFKAYGVAISEEPVPDSAYHRIVYKVEQEPLVSIIIPSKDNPDMCKVCLDSIVQYTEYENYEIILVDNGSSGHNRKRYQEMSEHFPKHCIYVYEPMEFNFSHMCNLGVSRAGGEYYLFLNDDIEIRSIPQEPDWLMRMLGQAQQPHTGAVGAKLLFPGTNRVQHSGVVNYERGADHIFSGMADDVVMDYGRNRLEYNYSAVTAACMLIDKNRFLEVGGFEEKLAVAFNDVELCFRLLEAGYYHVVRNDVVLYHHESVTRGNDAVNETKFLRNLKEREHLFELHPQLLKRDAFYSPNLIQKGGKNGINIDRSYGMIPVHEFQSICDMENKHDMKCHIYCVQMGENICIRGYAFAQNWKNNDKAHVELIFEKENRKYVVNANKVYNGTLALALDCNKRLSLAEFMAVFPQCRMEKGNYRIIVRLSSTCRRNVYVQKTDRTLKIR